MKLVLQNPDTKEIKVKLMLAGGHAAMIALPPQHPLLAQLFAVVAGRGGTMSIASSPPSLPSVFQIPVEGGRASLAFSSEQLVAVLTDPAVLVQPEGSQAAAAAAAPPPATNVPAAPRIVRHPVVQLDGFLADAELDRLRETIFAAEPRFQASWTEDDNKDYRSSLVLDAPEDVVQLVVGRIRAAMPEVIAKLRIPSFPVGRIECQVTASVDGSYFRVHTDSGHSAIDATRQLTYVYYFNREPKRFNGGELRVYDDQVRNDKLARTDSFRALEPRNNSIVFFHSAVMHEVSEVQVPSKDFRDSRFTVNGWIHRG